MRQYFLQTTAVGWVGPFATCKFCLREDGMEKDSAIFEMFQAPKQPVTFRGGHFSRILDLSGRGPSFTIKPGQICESWSFFTKTKWEQPLQIQSKASLYQVHLDFSNHILRAAGSMMKREGVVGQKLVPKSKCAQHHRRCPSILEHAPQFWKSHTTQ